MFEILMVCTGNICRSPMAAGLLRHMLPTDLENRIQVISAGTHAMHGHQAAPFAVQAMARQGIDISGHRARMIDRTLVRRASLILTTGCCSGANPMQNYYRISALCPRDRKSLIPMAVPWNPICYVYR